MYKFPSFPLTNVKLLPDPSLNSISLVVIFSVTFKFSNLPSLPSIFPVAFILPAVILPAVTSLNVGLSLNPISSFPLPSVFFVYLVIKLSPT